MSILLDKWNKNEIWDLYQEKELENKKLKEDILVKETLSENILETQISDTYIDLKKCHNEIKFLKEQIHKITEEKKKVNIRNSELEKQIKIYEEKPKEEIIKEYIHNNLKDDEGVLTWGLIRDDYNQWKKDKHYKNKPDVQELKNHLINEQEKNGYDRMVHGSHNNRKFNYKII